MTYEDPRSGRERNLGQDDVGTSTGSWIAGAIIVAAIALGAWYYYDSNRNVAEVNQPATTTATGSSQTGTTTGPAAPGSATGASSGTAGNTTQPSQDSTGVHGPEGNKNGPGAGAPKQ